MEVNEIQRRLDVMVSALLGKGKIQPDARFVVSANAPTLVSVSWVKRNAVQKYDRDYKAFTAPGAILADAEAFIAALPDLETERMAEFTERLAATIEMGREIGVDAEFVNPLVEAMKRLSENAIMDQSE